MAAPDVVHDQLTVAYSLGALVVFLIGGAIALPLLVRYHRVPAKDAPRWLVFGASFVLSTLGSLVLPHVAYERRLYVEPLAARFTNRTLFGERTDQVVARAEATRVVVRRWKSTGNKGAPVRGKTLIVESDRTRRDAAIELGSNADESVGQNLANQFGVPFKVEADPMF